MNSPKVLLAGLVLATGFAMTGVAQAAPQDNRCWGEAARGLAQFDSPNVGEGDHGGGMGMHSRSRNAADINGGFRNSTNFFAGAPGDTGQPRLGVGNATRDVHGVAPGDGGQGVHATNNGTQFSQVADPVTGDALATPNPDGTFTRNDTPSGGLIECSIDVEPTIPITVIGN